jgi:hypothetical protein
MVYKKVWSEEHIKEHKRLFNLYKQENVNIDISNYIDLNKRNIFKFIHNLKLGNASKEKLLFMVARYLDIKKDRYYGVKFRDAAYIFMKLKDEDEGLNKMDDKELIKYQPLEYFEEIIKSYDKSNLTNSQLFLYLITHQPPVRTSYYYTAKIITQRKQNNKIDNFLLIIRSKCFYIVNQDKVSNSKVYGNNRNSVIEIMDKELCNAIITKYKQKQSEYLFGDTKRTNSTLLNWVQKESKIKGLNIDNIRSIYITSKYDEGLNYAGKKKLALQMRHSVDTASKNYYKIIDKEDDNNNESIKDCENIRLELQYFKNKEKYLLDNKDKNYRKKRYDIIYNLNKNGYKPKKDTIDKFKIKYNDDLNEYY